MQIAARGYALAQAPFRVQAGKDPEVPRLVLLANRLTLAGVVVDSAGNPVEGVQVQIQPRNLTVAPTGADMQETKQDGRFHFHGLPRGKYRLLAILWKRTGAIGKDGRPVNKMEAKTELQVESGTENLRILLPVPQDLHR